MTAVAPRSRVPRRQLERRHRPPRAASDEGRRLYRDRNGPSPGLGTADRAARAAAGRDGRTVGHVTHIIDHGRRHIADFIVEDADAAIRNLSTWRIVRHELCFFNEIAPLEDSDIPVTTARSSATFMS